jgi:hypothetical protein
VYATPQQRESVRYALDIGANMTDFFTNYFQLAYPLPKQVSVLKNGNFFTRNFRPKRLKKQIKKFPVNTLIIR